MRRAMIGGCLIVMLLTVTAAAQTLLEGTVTAVDPATGRFALALDGGGMAMVQAADQLMTVVTPGARLQVAGQSSGDGSFQAERIIVLKDPTGVRSRLQFRP